MTWAARRLAAMHSANHGTPGGRVCLIKHSTASLLLAASYTLLPRIPNHNGRPAHPFSLASPERQAKQMVLALAEQWSWGLRMFFFNLAASINHLQYNGGFDGWASSTAFPADRSSAVCTVCLDRRRAQSELAGLPLQPPGWSPVDFPDRPVVRRGSLVWGHGDPI